jgi:hypothetical protein
MKRLVFVLSLFVVFMFSSQARADFVLLNNLDQPPSVNPGEWNIGSMIGQAFTTGQAVTITSATFRYDNLDGYSPSANAYLTIQKATVDKTDPTIDGTIDFSSVVGTWNISSTPYPLVTYSGNTTLLAGTTYWLVIHDINGHARVTFSPTYAANLGANLPETHNNYQSPDTYFGMGGGPLMFQVTTSTAPVPIPAAVWLLGSGLVGLIGIRRKFRK